MYAIRSYYVFCPYNKELASKRNIMYLVMSILLIFYSIFCYLNCLMQKDIFDSCNNLLFYFKNSTIYINEKIRASF